MSAVHVEALRHRLRALGARPSHQERVLRQWARAEPQAQGKRRLEDLLPLALRTALPALEAELPALASLRADHPGADGSRRLLVGLADGCSVEAVLLPRGGLCVSSQVGCAVGCVFCMTGIGGLERQLGSAVRSASGRKSSRRRLPWAWGSARAHWRRTRSSCEGRAPRARRRWRRASTWTALMNANGNANDLGAQERAIGG